MSEDTNYKDDSKIEGGYILQPRTIEFSDIMNAIPLTRELWFYILRSVQYRPWKNLKRGQGFFQYSIVAEDLCWYVGARKEKYSERSIMNSVRRLRDMSMITTTRSTRGVIIEVCNYALYQNPENYVMHDTYNETTTKAPRKSSTRSTINKKEKKDEEKTHNDFDIFWSAYDKKTTKQSALKLWNKISESDRGQIIDHVTKYVLATPDKKYRKDPSTYLRQKAWQDEIIGSQVNSNLSSEIKNVPAWMT